MIHIRKSTPSDWEAIKTLYPTAFPEEDLLPLVKDLLGEKDTVLSLIAVNDNGLLGHIIFTRCKIAGSKEKLALLGPLAVSPNSQKQGVGSKLILEGNSILMDDQLSLILVLGDPGYYSRFGFQQEIRIKPPYKIPEEWMPAWQSLKISDRASNKDGSLVVPAPWMKSELWLP